MFRIYIIPETSYSSPEEAVGERGQREKGGDNLAKDASILYSPSCAELWGFSIPT